MNLTELIAEFKEASGRLDFSDSEITKYLNRGIKFLDEVSFRISKDVRLFSVLEVGTFGVTLPREFRSVKTVWLCSTDTREELEFCELYEFRELYKAAGTVTNGKPGKYTLVPASTFANSALNSIGQWSDFPGNSLLTATNSVAVWPPSDTQRSLEVIGNFYTEQLSGDVPENWWSVNHPEVVIQAAIYRMDNNYRNTQGGKDLLESISSVVTSIYHDDLETQYNRPSKMEG